MRSKDVQIQRLTQNLVSLSDTASNLSVAKSSASNRPAVAAPAAPPATKTPGNRKKGRAAVVAWDLSHNPVGRAYVLYKLLERDYDVDLVGPIWSRYGDELWKPLQNADLKVRSFRCDNVYDFIPKANMLAAMHRYDVVYVCKSRLPSMYLGTLIKQSSGCPMVLDIDDFELSFFKDESTASLSDLQADLDGALREPYEELATRYAHSLLDDFDAITVSNIALREKFGGHIIRHARNENEFTVNVIQREQARARLGISDDEFALVFIGTPRPHKGIFDVAQALHELNDPSIVFHIVGDIHDQRVARQFENYPNARIVFHGDCEFAELPRILCAADLVPLIQDPDHAISQYQIPAKISDATSLGIPVIATNTPPLRDLALQGGIHVVTQDTLKDTIRQFAAQRELNSQANRTFFLNELSFAVNSARLGTAIGQARETELANATGAAQVMPENQMPGESLVEVVQSHASVIGSGLLSMLDQFDSVYRTRRSTQLQHAKDQARVENEAANRPGSSSVSNLPVAVTQKPKQPNSGGLASVTSLFLKRVTSAARHLIPGSRALPNGGYDIVFFWKQNDSGIYGRRSDMVTRYLAKSGKVGKVLHIDAPMSGHDVEQNFHTPHGRVGSHADQVLINLYDRQLHLRDRDNVAARTYLFSNSPRAGSLKGTPIRKKDDYVDFVRAEMEAAGMRPETSLAWFCPVVWDAPKLIEGIPFAGVVSDLIDDQRAWNASPEHTEKLEASYASTVRASDLVFTNCEPLANAFSRYASTIHVIPNGAERLTQMPPRAIPDSLRDLPQPVIGYVGNLRDRIDWMLLQQVVKNWPEASFVLVGPSNDSPNAVELAENPNVFMPGVVPYSDVLSYLRAFDVAIVPHLRNRLTEHMNPLKLYNYFAAGLPVVTSEISNINDMKSSLRVASTAAEFEAAIREAAESKVDIHSAQWIGMMSSIAWDTRVESMLEKLDTTFKRRIRKAA